MAILQKQVKNTEYFKFKQPIIFEYKLAVPANQDWNYQKSETNQTNRNRASGPNPIQPSSTNAVATQPWREHSLTLGTLPWLLLHDRMQCTSHWHGIMAGNFDRIGPSDTDFLITFGLILMLSVFFLKNYEHPPSSHCVAAYSGVFWVTENGCHPEGILQLSFSTPACILPILIKWERAETTSEVAAYPHPMSENPCLKTYMNLFQMVFTWMDLQDTTMAILVSLYCKEGKQC